MEFKTNMKTKVEKKFFFYQLLSLFFLGSFLLFLSLYDKSIESNFLLGYSKQKIFVLLFHFLILIINVLAIIYYRTIYKKFLMFCSNNNFLFFNILFLFFIVFTSSFYIFNNIKFHFQFFFIFQKLILILIYFLLILVNILLFLIYNCKSEKNFKINEFYFFFFLFIIIFLNIKTNLIAQVNSQWFNLYQENCDSLIMGRLVNWNLVDKNERIQFLVQYLPTEPGSMPLHTQKLLIEGDIVTEDDYSFIQVYTAQVGFQGTIYGLLSQFLSFIKLETTYEIIVIITVSLLSLIFTLFLLWIFKEFGFFCLIFSWIMILFNSWITAGGKSTYWQYWIFYFGFVSLLFYFDRVEKGSKFKHFHLSIIVFIISMLKFSMGFEYTTSYLIMISIPFFYYEIKNFSNKKVFILKLSNIIITSIISFTVSIGILLIKLYYFYPNKDEWNNPLNILYSRISKRTAFGDLSVVNPDYISGALTPMKDVFVSYFFEGKPLVFNLRAMDLIVFLLFSIIFFILFLILTKKTISEYPKQYALLISTIISLLSPISWIIFAKGHSADHTHFNYILFSMPFYFLLFLVISSNIQIIIDYMFKKT